MQKIEVDQKHNAKNPILIGFVERLANLEAQKQEVAEDIKYVLQEAKTQGYNPNSIKKILKYFKDPDAFRGEFIETKIYVEAAGGDLEPQNG